MIKVPYKSGRDYDELFEMTIGEIKHSLEKKNDDMILLCVGPRNTGKSMLMLHAMDSFMGSLASVDYIGMDKKEFATALNEVENQPLPRFIGNDEANVSKRDSLTKYNKDLIDMYFSIRGLNIFHWWNNPSINMIDKEFIEELLKGVIYINSKETKRPRLYYYFTKKGILKIWEKYGTLKLGLLEQVKKKYAFYRGWFKDYKGSLLPAYSKKKDSRMTFKVKDFYDKYGKDKDKLTTKEVKETLGVCAGSLRNYEPLLDEGDITKTATGRKLYSLSALEKIKEIAEIKSKKREGNINGGIQNG